MGFSRKEIKDNVLETTRQNASQIGSHVNEFINITLNEINDPGWAFSNKNFTHHWNFLRRKTTFTTVADTYEYVLPRDVDRIALLRQTDSPAKLKQIRDEEFFRLVPDPTATGNPRWYRLWDNDGVSTRLAAADTVNVVSSNAGDSGDSTLSVSVSGYDTNGIWRTETYQLNGTTVVSGSVTFAAREIIVQKQKDTAGSITVTENSGGTTLVVIGPQERAPKFKVVTLYPIPSSAITVYLEYYSTIPELNNDSDVPIIPDKYHYIVRLGTLVKVYQYLNKETEFATTSAMYSSAVRNMVNGDRAEPDLIEHLDPNHDELTALWQKRSEDAIA